MSDALRILLIDGSKDDLALAALSLRAELGPDSVEEVASPLMLGEHLPRSDYSVVICDLPPHWGDGPSVSDLAKRYRPDCVTILFTRASPETLATDGVWPHFDGFLKKDTAGFLQLPKLVKRLRQVAADRRMRQAPAAYDPLQSSPTIGVFSGTADGSLTQVNAAFARILAYSELPEPNAWELEDLFVDDEIRELWSRFLEGQRHLQELETCMRRADGTIAWIRLNAWSVTDPDHTIPGFAGTMEDITPYKDSATALSGRLEVLGHVNEELDQITYAVSHDLQEPVQLITRYAKLFEEKYAQDLDADACRYLSHLGNGAARIQALIDAVLEYTHVGKETRTAAPVDFNDVLREAIDNLKSVILVSGAEVSPSALPTLMADRRQMVQLFQNLLANAIKFRSEDTPQVNISARPRQDGWLFLVRDNGIGIDPKLADRIFGMFQRIHNTREYPGTGIGLAICKRIVEGHGGRIWFRSQPGKGATFFVTIPGSDISEPTGPGDGTT